MAKMKIKKGDEVIIIAGAENGKSGKIVNVDRKKERVAVEGCNIRKKAIRRSQDHPNGGIVEVEGLMHVSNVMLKEKYDARMAKKK